MADRISRKKRSEVMRRIRSKDTRPEMVVRRLVYSLGYRYRVHYRNLPGSPDLVLVGRRKVIFVHGCFWHQHLNCKLARTPKSRAEYWLPKFERIKQRDRDNIAALKDGWSVLVVWECETNQSRDALARRLKGFLES